MESLKQYFSDVNNEWMRVAAAKVKFFGLCEDKTYKVDFQNDDFDTFWLKVGTEYLIIAFNGNTIWGNAKYYQNLSLLLIELCLIIIKGYISITYWVFTSIETARNIIN